MFSFKKAAAGVLSCTMLLGSLVISGCSDSNTSGTQSADNTSNGSSTAHQGEIKDISSVELVKDMKMGWSLGNTRDEMCIRDSPSNIAPFRGKGFGDRVREFVLFL